MNSEIVLLREEIEGLRERIVNHPVYKEIKSPEDIRAFMQQHVFAVWDFMSLLKSLQRELTCVDVPWVPKGDAEVRQLINEIVLGEESDVDENGVIMSHFEMYRAAMQQVGADTAVIDDVLEKIRSGVAVEEALMDDRISPQARAFVAFTFEIIGSKKPHLMAAIFTFGREDLIPGMFISLVNDLNARFPDSISKFKYYLDRHIEVDGDHHSALAIRMTEMLCGNDQEKWREAREAVKRALEMRNALWNGVFALSA